MKEARLQARVYEMQSADANRLECDERPSPDHPEGDQTTMPRLPELFDRNALVGQERSTLDHLALTIAREDYEPQKQRLEALGLAVTTATHDWVHWRSIYVKDPVGNTVELVCYDPNV